jgi:hypothetical protein
MVSTMRLEQNREPRGSRSVVMIQRDSSEFDDTALFVLVEERQPEQAEVIAPH